MANDTGNLFPDAAVAPVTPLVLELDGPTLRCVYWQKDDHEHDERVCLVRCDNGERNVRRIRSLTTLCGMSCEEIERTSATVPGDRELYCNSCLAKAGHGVLR